MSFEVIKFPQSIDGQDTWGLFWNGQEPLVAEIGPHYYLANADLPVETAIGARYRTVSENFDERFAREGFEQ